MSRNFEEVEYECTKITDNDNEKNCQEQHEFQIYTGTAGGCDESKPYDTIDAGEGAEVISGPKKCKNCEAKLDWDSVLEIYEKESL